MRAYKTEIKVSDLQKTQILKTIGVSRFLYNKFLDYNKKYYEQTKKFFSGYDFSKYINNEFIKLNPEYSWIKEVSSKSTKQAIMQAEIAYKRFFKKQSKFPKFKKKNKSNVKMYFVKTDKNSIIKCERNKIKIPTIGWVYLKEKGYLPSNKIIKSGTIEYKAGRFYISVLTDENIKNNSIPTNEGIGIDLGIKDFAILSTGKVYYNINKSEKLKKLYKKLKRNQRQYSRKYEEYKKRSNNFKKEVSKQNLEKQKLIIKKNYQTIDFIKTDYQNKIISEVIKQKPSFITMEDLNISGMLKNRHLSKAIAQQSFYTFKNKLTVKANQNNIEMREVNRFYPSSKLCSKCGNKKADLKLSDRVYICDCCGLVIDRDLNASYNIKNSKVYKIIYNLSKVS